MKLQTSLACILILGGLLFMSYSSKAQDKELVSYVNTLQGTDSHWGLSYGNTYPTIGLPFAQQFYSAQTGKNGDGWKYQYQTQNIRGFQQVHQCSPWMNDYAVFSLMPGIGKLEVDENKRGLNFKHANETAKPHYYKVAFDNGIVSEISPVERGAHMRFAFPKNEDAFLILDGYVKQSEVTIYPKERKITGWVNNGRFVPGEFKSYFVMTFDQPFEAYGTWENKTNSISEGASFRTGDGAGAYLKFRKGAKVQVKIASSYITAEQAQLNFDRELGKHKTLEQTKKAAGEIWNKQLGQVLVEGGTQAEMETFYSCLFRANLFSRKFYELDKQGNPYYFSPYDAKVHKGYMYTDNGFWDTFRAQFPLNNILHPEMQGRYMQSLLDAQQQSGWFPTWSNPGMSGVMLGNHAISLLADAWTKGVRTFDPLKALEAYYHESTNKGPFGGSNGREGWKDYYTKGYIPLGEVHESTAKTLEYAYDDFCAYSLANSIGNKEYIDIYARQMRNYVNVFDPEVGFMRGRDQSGKWLPNFDPIEWGGPFTEGNSWQYSWSVFHNIKDLIGMMGGAERFNAKLDTLFTTHSKFKVGSYKQEIHEMTEMVIAGMGQYAHGNQPVQHVPYLYTYAGEPWKTQQRVRAILSKLYNATEKGYPGDEDQGQMSSWYVISALGLYSVCPGTDEYVIGSPVFRKATITLENGKKFVVEASNNSTENVYIQSATLNGKSYSKNFIKHSDIMNGGTIKFEMGNKPETSRGISATDVPFSLDR
ncbi:MAG: glycoside hydrolase family 92 protein [Pedobacter sp.]|nr:MAG: glycoside hydrolase family 92 protein [Pedobacter sp.]